MKKLKMVEQNSLTFQELNSRKDAVKNNRCKAIYRQPQTIQESSTRVAPSR